MSQGPDHGRLLRTGRTIARVVVTWAAVTGALVVLSHELDGFTLPSWWQAPVLALLLGLLSALVWPLVMRIALPVALFTLGIGSFLLLGAAVLALSFAVPGVYVADLGVAVVVGVTIAAVSGLVSSLLAVDSDELFFRRARRKAGGTDDTDERPPGVLFLQIDALSYDTARRAVRDGSMPNLAAWLRAGSHTMTSWHTDWSSQTGAAVSGILHGSNHDILGFRWYEKDRDHITRVSHPVDAAEVERRHSDGRGLLAGDGASRGNLFTGDAAHISLTMSSLSHVVPAASRRQRRTQDRVGSGYYAYFASPVNALRTIGVSIVDIFRELAAAARERRDDVRPRVSRGGFYPLARPGVTVISRDVVVYALLEDMLAGHPVAYADFLGYDEAAHHGGLERADSLAVLDSIDQQLGRLYRASALAPRRYHLVVLSDHGQTQGWAFTDRFGESIEELVGRLCGADVEPRKRHLTGPKDSRRTTEGWQMTAALGESAGPIARRLRDRAERAQESRHDHELAPGDAGDVPRVAPGVVCVVSGHTAMVSFTDLPGRVSLEEIERHWPDLLPGLVDHDGVGFLLVHSEEFGPVVLGRAGVHRLASGVVLGQDPLLPYGAHAAALVARVSSFPHCADVVINSRYDPDSDEASPFEPHVGSHGGLGGPQQFGFLAYPRAWTPPGEIVGAEQLHRVLRGWLTDLGHPEPTGDGAAVGEESPTALEPVPAADPDGKVPQRSVASGLRPFLRRPTHPDGVFPRSARSRTVAGRSILSPGGPSVTTSTDRSDGPLVARARAFRIPCLDGVRAIAVLLVFIGHAELPTVVGAGTGVTTFFFLSGYLITTLLRREHQETGRISLRDFYLRRAIRILPPMYTFLAVAVALTATGLVAGQVTGLGIAAAALNFTNYAILFGDPSNLVPGSGVLWSLAIEEHFYLLFPLLYLALLPRLSRRRQAAS